MQKGAILTKEDQAKYPFLREASNFVENFGLEFSTIEEYPTIIERAVDWVESNIEGKTFIINEEDPDTDILAYPLALAFIYGLKKDWVTNRFATAEQKRIDSLLQKDANAERIAQIAKKGFGWKMEPLKFTTEEKRFDFRINVADYLEVAPQFHSAQWKLVNRYLYDGKVCLKLNEGARLVSGGARNKILNRAEDEEIRKFELPKKFKPFLTHVMEKVDQRKGMFDESAPLAWVEEARPPCIVAILNDLEDGKNLSHMARFTITAFMTNVGKSVDETLALFNKVADFDEGKARYQVEHIAGEIGSRQRYNVPKCDVLRSFGLCVGTNELCENIWHPITYYKRRVDQLKKESPKVGGGKKSAQNSSQ